MTVMKAKTTYLLEVRCPYGRVIIVIVIVTVIVIVVIVIIAIVLGVIIVIVVIVFIAIVVSVIIVVRVPLDGRLVGSKTQRAPTSTSHFHLPYSHAE